VKSSAKAITKPPITAVSRVDFRLHNIVETITFLLLWFRIGFNADAEVGSGPAF
jgi:hypothetical protein